MTLGERIAAARNRAGLTQLQLAQELGLQLFQVADWERGAAEPSLEQMAALCRVLDVTSDYLLLGKEPESAKPICIRCGRVLEPGTHFCPDCGQDQQRAADKAEYCLVLHDAAFSEETDLVYQICKEGQIWPDFPFTEQSTKDDLARILAKAPRVLFRGLTRKQAVQLWERFPYPARLTYYAATPLKANNAVVTAWGWDDSNWTGWDNEVLASTRSIALENKINYGVAALETTVKFKANTIGDNQDGHIINIGTSDFALTGILVGGQPTKVDYNMEPTNDAAFTQTVWDCDMPETNMNIPIASSWTPANYTLLLDDKNKTNKTVQFALELQNKGTSTIYGQGGIIKPGMKFYLVGQLDPTTGTGNATDPDPADSNVDHVFIKDYLTKANVTISSFKNAYLTIPDLRSTQLQLGLYVDLTWQKGYTFNVEIGE